MAVRNFRFGIADCRLEARTVHDQQHLHCAHALSGALRWGRARRAQVSAIKNQQSGQASVWAMLALLVIVMVGAALLDAYQWASARIWAYHAAEAAAERGVTA